MQQKFKKLAEILGKGSTPLKVEYWPVKEVKLRNGVPDPNSLPFEVFLRECRLGTGLTLDTALDDAITNGKARLVEHEKRQSPRSDSRGYD